MGLPYTKTVTLVWDGVDWHDQHTGVKVTGIAKPVIANEAPSQSKHSFDESFSVTYEQVQKMIQDAFASRMTTAPPMAYFAPAHDTLVTYGTLNTLALDVQQLRVELWVLRQPWWKRWFRR